MKFILKHTITDNEAGTFDLHSILHANNAIVLDDTMLPDMAIVEVQNDNIQQLREHLGEQYKLFPEKKYRVPDTRKRLKG